MYEILSLKHVFSIFQETVWSHLNTALAWVAGCFRGWSLRLGGGEEKNSLFFLSPA